MDEIEAATDSLYDLCLKDINPIESLADLKELSNDIKTTYYGLRNTVCTVLNVLDVDSSQAQECVNIRTNFSDIENQYRSKVKVINVKRDTLGDAAITELSFGSKIGPAVPSDNAMKRCQEYVNENANNTEVIGDTHEKGSHVSNVDDNIGPTDSASVLAYKTPRGKIDFDLNLNKDAKASASHVEHSQHGGHNVPGLNSDANDPGQIDDNKLFQGVNDHGGQSVANAPPWISSYFHLKFTSPWSISPIS